MQPLVVLSQYTRVVSAYLVITFVCGGDGPCEAVQRGVRRLRALDVNVEHAVRVVAIIQALMRNSICSIGSH